MGIPILTSERAVLNLLRKSDFDEILKMFSEEDIFQYIPHLQHQTRSQYITYLEDKLNLVATGKGYYWVGRTSINGDLIGAINITPIPSQPERLQIGWIVRKQFWRKGYGKELATSIFNYTKLVLNISPIYGVFDINNKASEKILKGLGFEPYEKEDDTEIYRYVK